MVVQRVITLLHGIVVVQTVGCDWKIDSVAVEDHCGVCHGDGTTCKMVNKEFKEKTGRGGSS